MASARLRYNNLHKGRAFCSELRVVAGSDQTLFGNMSFTSKYGSSIVFSGPLKGPEHAPEKHT